MWEPIICSPIRPPEGYYRRQKHEQEFSNEKVAEVKVNSVEVAPSAIVNFAGLFFGVGCLLFTLLSNRKS